MIAKLLGRMQVATTARYGTRAKTAGANLIERGTGDANIGTP